MLSTAGFVNASAKQGAELKKEKKKIFVPLCFYNKQGGKCHQKWRDYSMCPFADCTGPKSEGEEVR